MSPNIMIIYVVFLIGIGVFFFYTNKKQKTRKQELVDNLKPGAVIETIGGFRGEVIEIKEDSFVLKSGSSTLEVNSRAVGTILEFTGDEETSTEDETNNEEVESNEETEAVEE